MVTRRLLFWNRFRIRIDHNGFLDCVVFLSLRWCGCIPARMQWPLLQLPRSCRWEHSRKAIGIGQVTKSVSGRSNGTWRVFTLSENAIGNGFPSACCISSDTCYSKWVPLILGSACPFLSGVLFVLNLATDQTTPGPTRCVVKGTISTIHCCGTLWVHVGSVNPTGGWIPLLLQGLGGIEIFPL